ncbi:MAG: DNA polymerase IV [Methanoregulaceae archaeon]|nr:DNA polymerase IV [Methanoregulaceae archaeon]
MGSRIILHVDMDSFFASVEVRDRPDLRGKPVVIGADPKGGKGRGVVSTASYEARAFGIHSAMPISTAYRLCPDAVFLPPDFSKYVPTSERIFAILSGYSPDVLQVSIDEAYLDIVSAVDFEGATVVGRRIKDEILMKERLTCSVGIGPSRIVAKIASDFRKPDGLTVVRPKDVEGFLGPLPVEKIPGIGRKTAATLHALGIRLVGDLAAVDVQELSAHFGKWGLVMHELALGRDAYEFRSGKASRSIGRETTFEQDTGDPPVVLEKLDRVSEQVHRALVREDLTFRTLTVKIRFEGFETRTRSRTLERRARDLETISGLARDLLSGHLSGRKIRLIGVRLSGLEEGGEKQKTLAEF